MTMLVGARQTGLLAGLGSSRGWVCGTWSGLFGMMVGVGQTGLVGMGQAWLVGVGQPGLFGVGASI
eukprot:4058408-Prorocentrum_lima.AAC.1